MSDMTEILLRLEQRITNIENFINRYDFDCLPEIGVSCKHAPKPTHGEQFEYQTCRKCGELYR